MNLYLKIKNYFMEKNPDIIAEYSDWLLVHGNNTPIRRVRAYAHLAKLCMSQNRKTVKIKVGEYEDNKIRDYKKVIEEISKYDVVSFDIFDTLILRNVERPEDVFRILGMQINFSGFSEMRKKAENIVSGKADYDIYDIYNQLNYMCGIDVGVLEKEFDIECQICVANPYMKEIYKEIIKSGKTVIATSDMYWPKEYIVKLLEKCGYNDFSEVFVSCEEKKSKCSGKMFRWLKGEKFPKKKVIHIGDNYNSDISMAKKEGLDAIQYNSVHEKGKKYRNKRLGKKEIGISVANAIINNEVHNGICDFDRYKQYGFNYGGMLIAGYCQFVNRIADENEIDKLLFLARDADVIYKAYNENYNIFENEYVYASRNSVLQLAFEKYTELFIEQILWLRFIEKRIVISIEDVLKQAELECLQDKLHEVNLKKEDIFDASELNKVIELIYKYKAEIVESFESARKGAYQYWKKVIGDAKSIALVDIGWQGSTMICLEYFLNEVCGFDVDLYTIQLGTVRTKWNEQEMDAGRYFSYCFSADFNKKLNDVFSYEVTSRIITEMLFTAPHPTLLKYDLDDNERYVLVFAEDIKENKDTISSLQDGVLEFVKRFRQIEINLEKELLLTGENAFIPLFQVSKNRKYVYGLFKDFKFSHIPGDAHKEKMSKVFKRNNYV